MALRDLKRRKKGLKWELYKTAQGKVPKDLLQMFVGVLNAGKPPNPNTSSKAILDDVETEILRRTLKYISRFGLPNVLSDEDAAEAQRMGDEIKPPVFQKLRGKDYRAILELKMPNTQHNPRFLGSTCSPRRLVFLHAFAKKDREIRQQDKDKALKRLKDLQHRGECK